MSAATTVVLVLALALVLVGFVFGLFAFIRRVGHRVVASASADPDTDGATTMVPALMQGGQTEAGHQLNGNGVLALFPTEVRFVLAVPRRTMTIPHASITSATVTKRLRLPGVRRAGGPPWLMIVWAGPVGSQSTGFQTPRATELSDILGGVGPTGSAHPRGSV